LQHAARIGDHWLHRFGNILQHGGKVQTHQSCGMAARLNFGQAKQRIEYRDDRAAFTLGPVQQAALFGVTFAPSACF
jgi:hypothetical protein